MKFQVFTSRETVSERIDTLNILVGSIWAKVKAEKRKFPTDDEVAEVDKWQNELSRRIRFLHNL